MRRVPLLLVAVIGVLLAMLAAPAAADHTDGSGPDLPGSNCPEGQKLDNNPRGTFDLGDEFGIEDWEGVSLIITELTVTADGGTVVLCVKGGSVEPNSGVITLEDGETYTHPQGISNVVVYQVDPDDPDDPDEEPGEWCSPGFWRNNPGSVAATGVDMSQKYNSLFAPVTPSNKALKDGATADPTLQQVLDSPQWYGGTAFNNVGDLLSAAADLEWDEELKDDAVCPFSADAAGKGPLHRDE
jgi:hypothetical protein